MSRSELPAQSATLRVSVVIPAYNYARYLPYAIESVLKQSFTGYELIVVDDGSTDNTAEVVARYGDRVRYLYQKNKGLPSARNTGIEAARGEFVGFLDADDEWLPDFLERAIQLFDRLPREFGLVASRSCFIDEHGTRSFRKRMLPDEDEEIRCRDMIFMTCFAPSAVVARRSALLDSGCFNPTLRSSEDRDMWIRVAARHRMLLHREALVLIRKHSSNMSRHATRMKENTKRVLLSAWKNRFAPRHAVLFWCRVFSFFYFQIAWTHYAERRRAVALRYLVQSMLLWPFFSNPGYIHEPVLFRVRSLMRFLANRGV